MDFKLISDFQPTGDQPEAINQLADFDSDKKTFRIKFGLESRPQSATEDKEYFVDVVADNFELKRISIELKNELRKYPERKPAHNSTLSKAGRTWWQKLFGF